MKRKDITELIHKSKTELVKEQQKLEKQLVQVYMEIALGKQKNFQLGKRLRDDVARIKTVIRKIAKEPKKV